MDFLTSMQCIKIKNTTMSKKRNFLSLLGLTQMDEIRGAEKVAREVYSYTLTELQRLHNEEVRHLRKS